MTLASPLFEPAKKSPATAAAVTPSPAARPDFPSVPGALPTVSHRIGGYALGPTAPIQGKWIIRGGRRVRVAENYELQPGERTPGGLRRRRIEPDPTETILPTPSRPARSASAGERFEQAGSAAGYLGMAASAAEHVHANPVSEGLAHVPVLGAVSSAATARRKQRMADASYLRGDLVATRRHQLGSAASALKSAADGATVASHGLTAPVTVPVSAAASLVNTATSVPEYAASAQEVARDPSRTASRAAAAVAGLPDVASSVGSSVSSAFTSAMNYVTGHEEPDPSVAEREREAQRRSRERQAAAADRARRLRYSKHLVGKLD